MSTQKIPLLGQTTPLCWIRDCDSWFKKYKNFMFPSLPESEG